MTHPDDRPAEPETRRFSLPRLTAPTLPAWAATGWDRVRAEPGRIVWPIAVVAGLALAVYVAVTAFAGSGPMSAGALRGEPVASDPYSGGAIGDASAGSAEAPQWLIGFAYLVAALAMLAALVWLAHWLAKQNFAPRIATALKLALALTPISVWRLATLDGVYQPMQAPLRSYLLLIACPFIAAGVLVALDRRRAWGLGALALLSVAGLFIGAGAIAGNPLESVEHLQSALLRLPPDQRMWWLALAALPVAVFAVVSAVGDKPDEAA